MIKILNALARCFCLLSVAVDIYTCIYIYLNILIIYFLSFQNISAHNKILKPSGTSPSSFSCVDYSK